jgi:hypothetical protein
MPKPSWPRPSRRWDRICAAKPCGSGGPEVCRGVGLNRLLTAVL